MVEGTPPSGNPVSPAPIHQNSLFTELVIIFCHNSPVWIIVSQGGHDKPARKLAEKPDIFG
ncbi:MAG: hypothetical protein B5M56_06740 [Desulfococcus sp. 4484_241]|nr:MAG: hypothetical protein B5M56_06740 [Desulfococcus sp. 4484_241]